MPEKLGFSHDADLRRRAVGPDGSAHALSIWSMFADEYAASPASELVVAAFDCIGDRIL